MTLTDREILACADDVSPRMRVREYDDNLLEFARAVVAANQRLQAFHDLLDSSQELGAYDADPRARMNRMAINLGSQYRDTITGLTGTATAKAQYLHGPEQVCIEPRIGADGKPLDGVWLAADRVEPVPPGDVVVDPDPPQDGEHRR